MAKGIPDRSLRKTIQRMVATQFEKYPPSSEEQGPKETKFIRAILGSAALAILLDAVWCYFAVSGLVHMGSARAILVLAWVVGTIGIAVSDWIWGKPFVHRVRLGIFASIVLGIALLGLDAWTARHRAAEIHPVAWADFPDSLANHIADIIYSRIAPLFAKQQAPSQSASPVAQVAAKQNKEPKPDLVLELTPFVILKRTHIRVEKDDLTFRDYGLAAIFHIINKEAEPRYIGRLEVEGDVSVDCSEYLLAFGIGRDIRDTASDCKSRKPYYHISWVATPIGETRVDPKGGERFIRFVILQPRSGGRVYSSLPGQQPDVKGYFGFESGGIKPQILTTVPYVFDLVYFAAGIPEGEGRDPRLRSEVDQGRVIIRVTVNSKIQALLRTQVMPVRWRLDTQWEEATPQDLFYATDPESRSMPVPKDPLMQPSH